MKQYSTAIISYSNPLEKKIRVKQNENLAKATPIEITFFATTVLR